MKSVKELKEMFAQSNFQNKETQREKTIKIIEEKDVDQKIDEHNTIHEKKGSYLEAPQDYNNRQLSQMKERNVIFFEKNTAYSISDLPIGDQDEYTKRVVKALLVYLSYEHEKDMFGWEILDPAHFAKTMKLSIDRLNSECPFPACRIYRRLRKKYNTFLENALFILGFRPLLAEFKTTNEEREEVKIKGINVLDEILFGEGKINSRGKKKKYYLYKINEYFERNLSNYYTKLCLESYITINKMNGEDFYIYLKNAYTSYLNNPKENYIYLTIERLAFLFNISIENLEIRFQKKEINNRIKKIIGKIENEIPNLKFIWEKSTETKENILKIAWDNNIEKHKLIEEKNNLFYSTLKFKFIKDYKTKSKTKKLNEESFLYWLQQQPKNYIISAYMTINKQIYKGRKKEQEWGSVQTDDEKYGEYFYNRLQKENVNIDTLFK